MNTFDSEAEMSKIFYKCIKNQNDVILAEFSGLFGIPDYVLIDYTVDNTCNVISIELKLKDWRRAVTQAFRYLNFSNKSFVILDEEHIYPAIKNIDLFKQYNIGLCSFSKKKEFKLYFNPESVTPFCEQSSSVLLHKVKSIKAKKSSKICTIKYLQ